MVYDGNETHTYKSGKALDVTFTANTMTVEIDPFYPSSSFSSEGFWAMTCTNPDFSVDAESTIEFSDPVVESFEQLTLTWEVLPWKVICILRKMQRDHFRL